MKYALKKGVIIAAILILAVLILIILTLNLTKLLYWLGFITGVGFLLTYLYERYKFHPIYKYYSLTEIKNVKKRLLHFGFKKAGIFEEIKVKNEIEGFILMEDNMQYHLRLIKTGETDFGISIHFEYAKGKFAHLWGYNDETMAKIKMIEVLS